MRRLALATGLALTLGCVPAPPITVASPSPPAPTPSATPIATATASPSPTESPGPLNIVTAVAVPRSFHYFSVGQRESFRILLFDEDRSQPPAVVLTSGRLPVAPGPPPDVRSEAISVSADGRLVVVMRRLSEQTTYYLLRPETGEIRELLSGIGLGAPVITADGSRIAYAQSSSDPALNGVWISAVTADRHPAPSRVVSDQPQRVGSPPQLLAWSDDGKWLAISPVLGPGGVEVAVVDPTGGETHFNSTTNIFEGGNGRVLGSGYAVDWRAGEHSLLITSTRDLFGGRTYIYVADVAGGPNGSRDLYAPSADVTLGPAVWHPSLDRFAIAERPRVGRPGVPTGIWVRRLDGTATKVAESAFLSDPWWSHDGTKLFSITGGDDSTGGISNLLGTGGGTAFCLRGGIPPGCT